MYAQIPCIYIHLFGAFLITFRFVSRKLLSYKHSIYPLCTNIISEYTNGLKCNIFSLLVAYFYFQMKLTLDLSAPVADCILAD